MHVLSSVIVLLLLFYYYWKLCYSTYLERNLKVQTLTRSNLAITLLYLVIFRSLVNMDNEKLYKQGGNDAFDLKLGPTIKALVPLLRLQHSLEALISDDLAQILRVQLREHCIHSHLPQFCD